VTGGQRLSVTRTATNERVVPGSGHPKVVQERLGHAAVEITLDVYSHVAEGLHSDASRVAGVIFGTGVSTPLANISGSDHE
jgi:hypothetical protein